MKDYIRICDVEKYYGNGANVTKAVDRVSFTVEKGEFVGVMGASGSGKTTLLNMLSTIDSVTAGHIYYGDTDITELKEDQLADFRKENLGFVFQDYNLLDTLTIEENITYPMELSRVKTAQARERAVQLLEAVGLPKELRKKYPAMLSGGEQQRVAIARALASAPRIILADEPTGNLDFENGENIIRILKNLVEKESYCVILVTHDRGIAEQADVVYQVQDGQILSRPEDILSTR